MSSQSNMPEREQVISYFVYHLQQGRSPFEIPRMAQSRWPGIGFGVLNDAGIEAAQRVSHLPITSALPGETIQAMAPWIPAEGTVETTSRIGIVTPKGEVFDFPLRIEFAAGGLTAEDIEAEVSRQLAALSAGNSAMGNTIGGAYSIQTLIEYAR